MHAITLNTYSGVKSGGRDGDCCSLETDDFNLSKSVSNSPESRGLCPVGGRWYGEKPPQSIPRNIPPDAGEVVDIVGPPAPGLKEPKGLLPEKIKWFNENLNVFLASMTFLSFIVIVPIFMKVTSSVTWINN